MKRIVLATAALLLATLAIYLGSKRLMLGEVVEKPVSTVRPDIAGHPSVGAPPLAGPRDGVSVYTAPTIYYAPDLATQETMGLLVQGPLKLDALFTQTYGLELCNYLYGSKNKTFVAQSASRDSPSQQDITSAKMLDAFRKIYCSTGTDIATRRLPYDFRETTLAEAAALGDRDAANLLGIVGQLSQEESLSASDVKQLESRLTKMLRRTTSPALFEEINQTLLDPAFVNWTPEGFDGRSMNEEDLGAAKLYGPMIAMCGEFGVCGPRSIYTLRACLPTNCVPHKGIDGYLKRILSQNQYDIASQYASALRVLRKE